MRMKARTVAGTGEKSLLGDPGPESRLGREKEREKERAKMIDGMSESQNKIVRIRSVARHFGLRDP